MQFGTDPEFFIMDAQNKPVPAHKAGFPPKEKKRWLASGGGAYFRDGYAVELNVPPSDCRQSLTFRIQRGLRAISAELAKRGYHLATVAAVEVDLKQLRRAPADVKQFGCEPSLCAHDMIAKVPPIDAMTHPYRYAGAHLHFSAQTVWQNNGDTKRDCPWLDTPDDYPDIIKLLDQYVGLPLTCVLHSPEQYLRRRFYGQAGEYRAQKYEDGTLGLEYRTPSPELWNTVWLSSLILGISRDVIKHFPTLRKTLSKPRVAAVRHAIDTGENRWKLLKPFPGASVPQWTDLHNCYRLNTIYHGPQHLIEANIDTISDGFAGWWGYAK